MLGFSHLLYARAVLGPELGAAVRATETIPTPGGDPQGSVPGQRGFWGTGPFLNVIAVRDNGEDGRPPTKDGELEPGRKGV